MPSPPRSTPYQAPGAPVSPIRQAVAGALVAMVSLLSLALGWSIELPAEAAWAISGLLVSLWGLWMDRRARTEQADALAQKGLLDDDGRPVEDG